MKFWVISSEKNNYLLFSHFQSYSIHPKDIALNGLNTIINFIPLTLFYLCFTDMGISLVICSDPAIHRFSRSCSEKPRKFYGRTSKLISFSIKMQACSPQLH